MKKGELYYLRTEGFVGNALLWWGKNHRGYTSNILQAGKYTRKEAENICHGRDTEKAYLCSVIDEKEEAKKLIIDSQFISSEDMAFNLKSLNSL